MEKIRNSLFSKLILLVMLVIILPSIVSNVIAYRQNYYMIQQQIIDWNENRMEIGMEQAKGKIRQIEQAPLNLYEHPDVVRILSLQTPFTDMERYVIRNYGKSVSDRNSSVFRVVMYCQNGEIIEGIYADDHNRKRIGQYQDPEPNGEMFQVGKDEAKKPAFLIYHADLQNVPAYDTIVSMRIYVDNKEMQDLAETLCGQYKDSAVMAYLGEGGKELAYTSVPFLEADYDEKALLDHQYAKGRLDGAEGMFFLKRDFYKGTEIRLLMFVHDHWFADPAKRVVLGAIAVQGCLLAVSVLFLFLVFNLFISPVRRMLHNMKMVKQKPEFVYKSETNRKDELGMLENQYAEMMTSLDELINKNYRYQLEVTRSRFHMLQAQINPHFLYNMLQYISTTALKGHCPEVSRQLTQLGELFQYTMNTGDDVVTLKKELRHLENYIALQEGRFAGRLHFIIHCSEKTGSLLIPKMILQPLVENSIKHGIDQKDGMGNIMISIVEKAEQYLIRVIDNGAGMRTEQIQKLKEDYDNYGFLSNSDHGIGLLNVLQRCSIYYGERFRWEIRSIPEVETMVELVVLKGKERERHESDNC